LERLTEKWGEPKLESRGFLGKVTGGEPSFKNISLKLEKTNKTKNSGARKRENLKMVKKEL